MDKWSVEAIHNILYRYLSIR